MLIFKTLIDDPIYRTILIVSFLFTIGACKKEEPLDFATNDFTSNNPIIDPEIERIIQEEFAYQGLIGLNVAVMHDGEVIHRNGYGYRDLGSGAPVATENVFFMNSISKSITAVLAEMLRNEPGIEFSWDEEIRAYTPEYAELPCDPIDDAWRDGITLRHLLSNTAGIPHYCEVPWEDASEEYSDNGGWSGTLDSDALIDVFCKQSMIMPPGSGQYRYSSFGFNLAGCVINDVGNEQLDKGYYELADEWLRKDWGMDNLVPDEGAITGKPMRYEMRCDGSVREESNTEDRTWVLPGSGWLCNPDDLAKFGNHLINGAVNTNDLWMEINEMPEIGCNGVSNGSDPDYGHGFSIYDDSPLITGHGGSHPQGGAKSLLTIHPSENYVIVGMTNTDWWQWNRIRNQIETYLTGLSKSIPPYDHTARTRCDANNTCPGFSPKVFNGIWESNPGALRTARYEISSAELLQQVNDLKDFGFIPVDVDFRDFDDENNDSWNAVFEQSSNEITLEINRNLDNDDFESLVQTYEQLSNEVRDLEIYTKDGNLKWAAIFEKTTTERVAKIEMDFDEFGSINSGYIQQGFLPIDIEIYKNSNGQNRYACVWEEKSGAAQIFVDVEDPGNGMLPSTVQANMASTNMEIIDHEYHGTNKQAFILHTASSDPSIVGINLGFCGLQNGLETQTSADFWLKDLEEK